MVQLSQDGLIVYHPRTENYGCSQIQKMASAAEAAMNLWLFYGTAKAVPLSKTIWKLEGVSFPDWRQYILHSILVEARSTAEASCGCENAC